ncbi:hypothetical protein GGP72_003323 [Salinibacter ruber]|uniref:Uncharacterized protein n=2 Tax=Salinibacter ruber TaxID=146919 RepID=A0A9X2TDF3_9BACT|nr:hypothetical protein [Salinibacter ruber]MCS3682659.1 hypothetical protein [Salinibacter ruber]
MPPESTPQHGPVRKATASPGAVTRCYKAMCAVCGRTDIYDGHDKERDVWPQLREHGWKQTTRLTEGGSRHWICAKHHEPGSYKVYRDKEIQRVELGPGDVPGLE